MTIERAAELVSALYGDEKIDLFVFFETHFGLNSFRREVFASMCGFGVVADCYRVV